MITDGKLSIYLTIQAQLVGQKEMMAAQKKQILIAMNGFLAPPKATRKLSTMNPCPHNKAAPQGGGHPPPQQIHNKLWPQH